MRFPPPVRFSAPLIALTFGLIATWLDYRLNLDLDLRRHLTELRDRAESSGRRLAQLSERLIASANRDLLQQDLAATADAPGLGIAAVVDENGMVVEDSSGELRGRRAASTQLASAAALISSSGQSAVRHAEDSTSVVSAHPFRIAEGRTGWVLLDFDRAGAIAAARADAVAQLRWMASAMTLLSFILWAVLHFGLTSRLGRLAEGVRALAANRMDISDLPSGSDEVGQLSAAFTELTSKLREREAEQLRLEQEVLEVSESERRRIGRDLHDGVGQRLTAASLATNAAVSALQKGAPAYAESVAQVGRQIRDAIAETRLLSHGLAPVALTEDGLSTALASLAESSSRGSGVRAIFEQREPISVSDGAVAGHLYRIAQEAVNNALKHATASEIRIGLERREGSLLLEVDDDGRGFEENAMRSGGIGLRVMRYRAQLIGGVLDIGPAPAGGTRVSCRVKLPT